ncbi:GDSL-type esterase/lipase family protein [Pedobacter xixiisoli]|uniref:Lysophospholipase L1 n=1 Tax=Pedobacter xixiisoli TaxID=1476464 RepID=A0A285ZQ56_9SPHI|nr:GDSL-type esterase/lipase family protein [Pedobacter xixiisoli]SOD11767.1 Lysophospholipase L1 [Pedobacter xixiisoli]
MKNINYLLIYTFLILGALSGYAQQQKKDLNIVFIGNSITYGGGLADRAKDAPTNETCAWLRLQAGVGNVEFSNQGVSGHTSVDVLPKTNTDFPTVLKAARSFANTDALLIFSIKLGTNDSAVKGPKGAPVSNKDYYNNLKVITDSLLSAFPKSKIIYQQPIWYSPNTHNRSTYMQEGLDRLQTYGPELRKLVKYYKKANPGSVYLGDIKAFRFFKKHHEQYLAPEQGTHGTFYLHPNKEGAHILGDFWAKAIYKALF